ncbi:hypothetical protein [Spirulina sp. 06S082]|nr:hypothetical protein [Spirulina sp. 06S082]
MSRDIPLHHHPDIPEPSLIVSVNVTHCRGCDRGNFLEPVR